MILPHLENAVVPPEKLTQYILSTTREDGAGKAAFFDAFGCVATNWPALAKALLNHVAEHGIMAEEETPFGTRYIVEGPLTALDGRRPNLRSVRFIETGSDIPRFIADYPRKGVLP